MGKAGAAASDAVGRGQGVGPERRSLLGNMLARTDVVEGVEPVTVVAVEGRITFGDGDELLKKMVDQLVEGGCRRVLVDTSAIDYMDSSGVDAIVRSYNKLAERGGKLRLVVSSERIKNLFEITKLFTIIEAFPSREEALRAWAGETQAAG